MPSNIHRLDDTGGPRGWLASLPVITRYWFGLSFFLTCAANFEHISVMKLIFDWDSIWKNFEVWRFVTAFLYVRGFSPLLVFTFFQLVIFSQRHELGPYNTGAGSSTADYAFALIFGMATIILTRPIMGTIMPVGPIFARNLIFFVVYAWSKRYPTVLVSIWFVQMKAIQYPFAYVLFSLFIGEGISDLLHGIAVGHLYYFLVDVVPVVYGKDLLHTPDFLINFFGIGEAPITGYATHRPQGGTPASARRERHSWGGGRSLGSN